MAVTSVKQTSDRKAERLEDNVRRYVVNYVVITDSLFDTEYDVLTNALVPQRGSVYAGDTDAKAWQARATCRENTKNVWDVEVEYYTLPVDRSPTEFDGLTSPFEIPTIHEYRTMHTTRSVNQDRNGNPITNSAGEPFDAADATIPHAHSAWVVTYNRPSFNAFEAQRYTLAVNSVAFNGWAPRTVLCWDISASQQYNENVGGYYQITIELHLNVDTWDLQILDAGHRAFGVSPFGVLLPFYFEDGTPDPVPRLLGGTGFELQPGGQPFWRRFQVYKEEDLNQLEFDL